MAVNRATRRLTVTKDGQILDVPNATVRSLFERYSSLLEDLSDADPEDQAALARLLRDEPHPVQVMDDGQ